MYDFNVVTQNIEYLISHHCDNQEDFLAKTGINRTTIQRYKNEEKFSKLTIEKIITAFNLDVDAKSFCENLLPEIDTQQALKEKIALDKTIKECLHKKFENTKKVELTISFINNLEEIQLNKNTTEKLENYIIILKNMIN